MSSETTVSQILSAVAVAVVYVDDLPKDAPDPEPDEDGRLPKFVVHPHVETIDEDDEVLFGYLREIYAGKRSMPTGYPESDSFALLAQDGQIRTATVNLAGNFARQMARRRANRGIVFGAKYTLTNGMICHGVLKVDLNPDQRFHFTTENGDGWSLEQIRDILPPPKQNVAKYVIAPHPLGDADAGMLDATQSGQEKAAKYLLNAVGLTVPQTTKTRAQVATTAAKEGVSAEDIHNRLQEIDEDIPTEDLFRDHFPEVPDEAVEKAAAADSPRPMPMVVADDDYTRVYKSRGRFELKVSPDVDVQVGPRRLTIQLPADAEPITTDFK